MLLNSTGIYLNSTLSNSHHCTQRAVHGASKWRCYISSTCRKYCIDRMTDEADLKEKQTNKTPLCTLRKQGVSNCICRDKRYTWNLTLTLIVRVRNNAKSSVKFVTEWMCYAVLYLTKLKKERARRSWRTNMDKKIIGSVQYCWSSRWLKEEYYD